MKWLELSVGAPPEFVEPLSQIFFRYGHGGVVVESDASFNPDEGESPPAADWVTVKTYVPLNSTTEERRHRIDLGVRLVAHVCPISPLQARELDEEEWQSSWKQHFDILHIGRHIVIRPTWKDYVSEESDVVISLDPGMAFGTGHHPTTRRCLELLEHLVKTGADVLDVGCGSGILSVAASKLGARRVMGLEIDSVATKVAKENIRENGVGHAVLVSQGSLPHPGVREHSYDVVVANISAKVVSEAADELVNVLKRGGKVIASGLLLENKDRVERAFSSAGALLQETHVDGDWVTLLAFKP